MRRTVWTIIIGTLMAGFVIGALLGRMAGGAATNPTYEIHLPTATVITAPTRELGVTPVATPNATAINLATPEPATPVPSPTPSPIPTSTQSPTPAPTTAPTATSQGTPVTPEFIPGEVLPRILPSPAPSTTPNQP